MSIAQSLLQTLLLWKCVSHACFSSCVFSDPQEVAVKEQLTGKGKLSRRSISSPNVNRVSARDPSLCSAQDLLLLLLFPWVTPFRPLSLISASFPPLHWLQCPLLYPVASLQPPSLTFLMLHGKHPCKSLWICFSFIFIPPVPGTVTVSGEQSQRRAWGKPCEFSRLNLITFRLRRSLDLVYKLSCSKVIQGA